MNGEQHTTTQSALRPFAYGTVSCSKTAVSRKDHQSVSQSVSFRTRIRTSVLYTTLRQREVSRHFVQ